MPDALPRARHREVAAPAQRARTVARRGLHALVLTVIAGGTVAFAGAATTPDAAPPTAGTSLAATTSASSADSVIDRATLAASRFEARAPIDGVAVEIVVDGEAREVTSQAATVADLLAEAGVVVDQDDVVSTTLTTPVVAGMTVEVTTVDTVDQHVTETDEYETIEEEDDSLPRGERRVVTEGVDGVTATTFRITVTGGEETAREVVARAVVSERVDEVVRVGTAEPVVAAPRQSAPADASSGAASAPAAGPVASGSPKAIAADMVAARGWGTDQFNCLDVLWERESNWNPSAQNPSSGAYGIPQSLPGSKMASVAADWRTNPATQITWGLNYIAGRYGTPCGALGHSNSVGWY